MNNPTWDGVESSTWLNKADYLLSSVSPLARREMSNANKKALLYMCACFILADRLVYSDFLKRGDQVQGLLLKGTTGH